MAFIKVAQSDEIAENSGRIFEVSPGRFVALFNHGGSFYALDNECPHEGGPLGEGDVQRGCVSCPWHGYRFDLATGACVNSARLKVAKFAVRVEGGDILVDV
ncbi:MAG: Rieske (2Fe-2S) protein [Candidatus Binataceae bacterium]|nr:Rieske (2Fe-2S) protein [Candidatus Binataceae bacterium]